MTRGLFTRPFEEMLSNTYDAIEPRNRRDDEARDRSDALLKGNTIEETMANVYDHIQEREANKDRSAVLTNRQSGNSAATGSKRPTSGIVCSTNPSREFPGRAFPAFGAFSAVGGIPMMGACSGMGPKASRHGERRRICLWPRHWIR